jgi:hypothetical protein
MYGSSNYYTKTQTANTAAAANDDIHGVGEREPTTTTTTNNSISIC